MKEKLVDVLLRHLKGELIGGGLAEKYWDFVAKEHKGCDN